MRGAERPDKSRDRPHGRREDGDAATAELGSSRLEYIRRNVRRVFVEFDSTRTFA